MDHMVGLDQTSTGGGNQESDDSNLYKYILFMRSSFPSRNLLDLRI